MACQICQEAEGSKKISLYNHQPGQMVVCQKHSWELFLLGERRFVRRYNAELGGEYKMTLKKSSSGKSSLVG